MPRTLPGAIRFFQTPTVPAGQFRSIAGLAELIRSHWPEYLMEAASLGLFMFSACSVIILFEHPLSPLSHVIRNSFARRVLIGIAMGITAIALTYSPWGKQSGAHLNPSITLAFFRLGKISTPDAVFYVLAQFIGARAGVLVSAVVWGSLMSNPSVRYAVTVPGPNGPAIAFLAEFLISLFLMTAILRTSNSRSLHRFTGILAGTLIATFIAFESPLSGMSTNPARTLASAIGGRVWDGLWIYFTAPPLGMLVSAELYALRHGEERVFCAKLHHANQKRCIFRCNYARLAPPPQGEEGRQGP